MKYTILLLSLFLSCHILSQDLSEGLVPNDLSPHPMQELEKPEYLGTVIDPSFGTTIRRITDAAEGENIRTMYSTVQAWNADESRIILYGRPGSRHLLLDGFTYEYIRDLDINPSDLEEVFWHFENPELLYYMDASSKELIAYNVAADSKTVLANLRELTGCTESMKSGNDVQTMSWDSDLFSFRCGNNSSWIYRISTGSLQEIQVSDVSNVAAVPFPSGERFLHGKDVYNMDGTYSLTLDADTGSEHSCIGRDAEGNDRYFAVAFAQSTNGNCLGEIIAYDPLIGNCRTIMGTELGYSYTQSGTHISALAHKNTQGGWVAASMMGYDQDGQDLLDQELVIAYVSPSSSSVYRIAHHRSDEDEFDYWGEPHPVISPSGTRVLFNSDWSGAEDGLSVDTYVVELPAYKKESAVDKDSKNNSDISIYPNPTENGLYIEGISGAFAVRILGITGQEYHNQKHFSKSYIDLSKLAAGIYSVEIRSGEEVVSFRKKFIKI